MIHKVMHVPLTGQSALAAIVSVNEKNKKGIFVLRNLTSS